MFEDSLWFGFDGSQLGTVSAVGGTLGALGFEFGIAVVFTRQGVDVGITWWCWG